jgi:PRTRC genetic system protein B
MSLLNVHAHNFKTKAILLHHGENSFDLTVHDVFASQQREGEPHYQMGAGRVLGIEEKNEIACTLTETSGASLTLFDERILAATAYAVAWWIPAGKRTINFRKNDASIESLTFDFPSQVAVFSRGTLYFASLNTKKARPKASSKLFNSPLPNLYRGGHFCTGSAGSKIPPQARIQNIPVWESFLFETTNTHLGSEMPLKDVFSTEGLIEAIKAEKGGFPTQRLVPMGVTLSEWLNSIDQHNTRSL